MDKRDQLQQAIDIQESLRGVVPDSVVDAAIAAIQAQLDQATPKTATPQRQRKQVTVLFADVSGFTAMSEKLDAEDVSDTMNALWQRIDKAILEWNGHIDKHIGDAVMALWGTAEAREDDPKLAVHAALAIQTAVHTFNQERTLSLALRIGLNTGPALLGEVGTLGEFTAMGDTVNVASRLETAADLGGILISHDTYQHVRGLFSITPLPPLHLKGKSEPFPTYAVNGVKPRAFRLRTRGVEGIQTRMIGRQTEMTYLQQAWHSAKQDAQTSRVTIVGEAGVGKSRLLYEFENWLDLRPDQVHLFKGRSAERTASTPYFLLRDLFATRFGLQEGENIHTLREKLLDELTVYLPTSPELKTHILGQWLGYDFNDSPHVIALNEDSQQLANRGLTYFLQLITAMAQEKTIVIFLEDIHWADTPSLNALNTLCQRRPNLSLFLLSLTRPTFFQTHPDWETDGNRLDLYPLPAASDRDLLREILQKVPEIPPELFTLVGNRAEGNPFYMEELVKMLIDNGTITTATDVWHVDVDRLNQHAIPSTLTGIIQARLDQLTPTERKSLQAASIVGRVFWDQAVQHLLPHAEIHFTPLQNKEVIFPHTDANFYGIREFIFKHDILRDVVYQSVLKPTRRLYHEQTAEWLITICQTNGRIDEYAIVIADHYTQAQATTQATQWYYRAGQQAVKSLAYHEALRCYNLALEQTAADDWQQQYQLLLAREAIYHIQGQRDHQRADLQRLETIAAQLDDPEIRITVCLRQAQCAEVTGNYPSGVAYAQQAVTLAQTNQLAAQEAQAHLSLGHVVLVQTHSAEAGPHFERALDLAQQTDQEEMLADCFIMLGVVAYFNGDYYLAQEYHEKCIEVARRYQNRPIEGGAFNNLGFWAYKHGDYDRAIDYLTGYLPTVRETSHRQMEAIILNNLANTRLAKGNFDQAQQDYTTAIHIAREIGDTSNEAISLTGLGRTLIFKTQFAEALPYLQQAITICQNLNQTIFLMEAYAQVAWIQYQQNQLTTAVATIEPILTFLEQGGSFDNAEYGLHNNLICCYILQATADPRAAATLTHAYNHLHTFAQRFNDPKVRHNLFTNITWHRELITLFEAQPHDHT